MRNFNSFYLFSSLQRILRPNLDYRVLVRWRLILTWFSCRIILMLYDIHVATASRYAIHGLSTIPVRARSVRPSSVRAFKDPSVTQNKDFLIGPSSLKRNEIGQTVESDDKSKMFSSSKANGNDRVSFKKACIATRWILIGRPKRDYIDFHSLTVCNANYRNSIALLSAECQCD